MNLIRVNAIAFKGVSIIFGAGLFFIGFKLVLDLLFVKGLLSFVSSGLLLLLFLANATLKRWLQIVLILAIVYEVIGGLHRI